MQTWCRKQRNHATAQPCCRSRLGTSAVRRRVTCAVDRQHIVADTYQDHQLTGGVGILSDCRMNTPTARSRSVSMGCCDAISVLLHGPDGVR
jgi:hypothetical protein